MNRVTLACLLLALAGPLQVHGQDSPEMSDYERCVTTLDAVAGSLAHERAPSLDRERNPLGSGNLAPTPTTSIALRASDNGSSAEFSLAKPGTDRIPTWTIKGSAPFDKNTGEGLLLSDQGVSGDFNLGTGLTWTSWNLDVGGYAEKLCGRCRDQGIPFLECQPRAFDDSEELIDALAGDVPFTKWGVELVGGRKDREYFDPDGNISTEDRVGYSVALFAARLIGRTWTLQGRTSWKRDFDEQDSAELCTSVDNSPLQTCKTKPFGRADEKESLILSLQGIRYFSWDGLDRPIAFAPLFAYDFEEDQSEIVLPLYLATNKDGAFTGGFRGAWRPDADDSEDEWELSVLISKPLSIFE